MKQQLLQSLASLIENFVPENASTNRPEEDNLRLDSLVLFGSGAQGRKTLAGLRKHGIAPLAFVDNNSKLWGGNIDGLEILSPELIVGRYPKAVFIVTIWSDRIGHPLKEIRGQMIKLGVSAVFSFTALSRRFPETFLPDFFMDRSENLVSSLHAIKMAGEIWGDQYSLEEYLSQLKMRMTLDLESVTRVADYRAYFPNNLFTLSKNNEVFVDCGAFDGDTLKDFLKVVDGRFKKFFAIEPDKTNYQKLRDMIEREYQPHSARILPFNLAVGEQRGIVRFSNFASTESRIDDAGTIEVECLPLDELLAKDNPTYIKMDIEGSEKAALLGGRETIARSRPVLAVSAYHKATDLWELPLLICELVADYAFFLRPEKRAGWDLICYAVPRERLCASNL
jgi:FkbM family methyltransferase